MAPDSTRSKALPGSLSATTTATAMWPPETPTKAGRNDVREYLDKFCRQFDIQLPIDDTASPSTRQNTARHAVLNKVRVLYWREKAVLDQAVNELLAQLPEVKTLPDRLEVINAKLAVVASRSPNKSENHSNAPALKAKEPGSPTLGVKRNTSRSAAAINAALDFDVVPLGEPLSPPFLAAATSFDTAMNRSFMTSSTDFSRTSTNTAATSFYDEDTATKRTDFLSSSLGIPIDELDRLQENTTGEQQRNLVTPKSGAPEANETPASNGNTVRHISHKIRDLPLHGLFRKSIPTRALHLPFELRCETYRILRRYGQVAVEALLAQYVDLAQVKLSDLHSIVDKLDTRGRFQRSQATDYSDTTLSGSLNWPRGSSLHCFDFELKRPQKDKRNSFQRKFGGDRLFNIDLPDLDSPPQGFDTGALKERFLDLVSKPQQFLGRTWEFLTVQEKKRKRGSDSDGLAGHQIYLFATEGCDLDPIGIEEVLNWWMPYGRNAHQPVCKLFSRLDLAISRTDSTLTLTPEQIKYNTPDRLATHAAADPFADPAIFDPNAERYESTMVMTDGASFVSVKVMNDIRIANGLTIMPAAYQGRICGSKGLYVCDQGYGSSDSAEYLNINDSQMKVIHELGETTDDEHLTLNVVGFSNTAEESFLYSSFILPLEDRGVPRETLLSIAKTGIAIEIDEITQALEEPTKLHHWIHKERQLVARRNASTEIVDAAEFNSQPEERACQMLEAGFEPRSCRFLALQVQRLAQQALSSKAKNFKLPLHNSTMLKGIPDLWGVLGPGEVHLKLSEPFVDPVTGRRVSQVLGEMIVTRHPCLASWDMQKVLAVMHPLLADVHDVIVFSTKGNRPIAGMLSGGDYDGDLYWASWDRALTGPFKNAPAPWQPPDIEELGITKDNTKVWELSGSPAKKDDKWTKEVARAFIRHGIAHAMAWNAVGEVTNKHTAVTYKENSVSCAKGNWLVGLRDVIIDAKKQGYIFPKPALQKFLFKNNIVGDYGTPPWRKYIDKGLGEDGMRALAEEHKASKNLLDQICFNVVQPIVNRALDQIKHMVKEAPAFDSDLTQCYNMIMDSAPNGSHVAEEAKYLRPQLEEINDEWARGMGVWKKENYDMEVFHELETKCRQMLGNIQPNNASHETSIAWLQRRGHDPTIWDELKASALAKFYYKGDGKMMFSIAGNALCHLKARARGVSRKVLLPFHKQMRPRAPRTEVEILRDDPPYIEDGMDEGSSSERVFERAVPVPLTPLARTKRSRSPHPHAQTSPKCQRVQDRTPKSALQSRTNLTSPVSGPRRAATTDGLSNGQRTKARIADDQDGCGFLFPTPPRGVELPKGQFQSAYSDKI